MTLSSVNDGQDPVVIGSDHAGFALKERIKAILQELQVGWVDVGTYSEDSCDYPDIARRVASGVSRGEFERGILCCGSGIGVSIAANKVRGVRAALCHDVETAILSRKHNDANVLCLGGRLIEPDSVVSIVKSFLETEFEGGRHEKRVAKIEHPRSGEEGYRPSPATP